MTLTDH